MHFATFAPVKGASLQPHYGVNIMHKAKLALMACAMSAITLSAASAQSVHSTTMVTETPAPHGVYMDERTTTVTTYPSTFTTEHPARGAHFKRGDTVIGRNWAKETYSDYRTPSNVRPHKNFVYINPQDREALTSYVVTDYSYRCAEGMRSAPACAPHLKNVNFAPGDRLPKDVVYTAVPLEVTRTLKPLKNSNYSYVQAGSNIFLIDTHSNEILDAVIVNVR